MLFLFAFRLSEFYTIFEILPFTTLWVTVLWEHIEVWYSCSNWNTLLITGRGFCFQFHINREQFLEIWPAFPKPGIIIAFQQLKQHTVIIFGSIWIMPKWLLVAFEILIIQGIVLLITYVLC